MKQIPKNDAIVKQAMVIICEATDMAIMYFTKYAKKDKNFLLTQDFVIWLKMQYKLKMKII